MQIRSAMNIGMPSVSHLGIPARCSCMKFAGKPSFIGCTEILGCAASRRFRFRLDSLPANLHGSHRHPSRYAPIRPCCLLAPNVFIRHIHILLQKGYICRNIRNILIGLCRYRSRMVRRHSSSRTVQCCENCIYSPLSTSFSRWYISAACSKS